MKLNCKFLVTKYSVLIASVLIDPIRGRLSGGVATYVRDDIAANIEISLAFSNGVVEALCLYCKSNNFMIINLYRQPDVSSSKHRSTSSEFKSALNAISETLSSISPAPLIIFTGDFNLPHINWENTSTTQCATPVQKLCFSALKAFINDYFLTQYVTKPTHYQGNTLDLVFTNDSELIFDYKCVNTLLTVSHHKIIEISTSSHFTSSLHITDNASNYETMPPLSTLNFHHDNIDWNSLQEDLCTINWDLELRKLSVNEVVERIMDISYECALKFVPKRKTNCKVKSVIPRDRRKLMTRRRRINKRLVNVRSSSIKDKLRKELLE